MAKPGDPLEQKIQTDILEWLNAHPKVWGINTVVVSRNGCPDIIACIEGRFCGIEVKRPGEKATPIQLEQIRMIRRAGGIALVATSIDDVRDYFEIIFSM